MIGRLVHNLTMDRLGEDAAGFILREQHQPTAAFDILYERLMRPIQKHLPAARVADTWRTPDRTVVGRS